MDRKRRPLDDFKVNWDRNVVQSFYTTGDAPPPREHAQQQAASSPIKHFFDWQEHVWSGRGKIKVKRIGERFKHMFFSALDLPDEEEWRFERPLGKGSFGAAVLFTKVNDRQEVEDAFALKVTDASSASTFLRDPSGNDNNNKYGLTEEAAIMAQTNDLQSDSIVRLRQFKVDEKYCRYYFEFCEYGSLETLRIRYKAWNMYLPEAFLWHVFYFLARACLEFSSGRFRSLAPRTFGKALPGQYLLHNDIKTDNVLLGSPYLRTDSNLKDKNDKGNDKHRCWYPIPKVADFGLSVTTNPEDESASMAQSLQCGTSVWFPPEQRIRQMRDPRTYHFEQDVRPDFRPFGGVRRWHHRIRPEANIWAVGAVMWSLTTLGEIEGLSSAVDDILAGTRGYAHRAFCASDHGDVVAAAGFAGLPPAVTERYSPDLLALIRACLRLRPSDRPPPDRLVQEVEARLCACMERETERLAHTHDRTSLVVALHDNEINALPDGGQAFHKHRFFWRDFADHLLWMPRNWGPLCPPEAPVQLPMNPQWPSPLRKRAERDWAVAIRDREERRAPPPPLTPPPPPEFQPQPVVTTTKITAPTLSPVSGEPLRKRRRLF